VVIVDVRVNEKDFSFCTEFKVNSDNWHFSLFFRVIKEVECEPAVEPCKTVSKGARINIADR